MYKTVLFTHTDLDGMGSRIVYELAYDYLRKGIDYDVYMCENADLDSTVLRIVDDTGLVSPSSTTLYFADLCASLNVLYHLHDKGYDVKIFDHHPTNLQATQVYPDAVVKPENEMGVKQCGTSLLYQYFCGLNPTDPRIKYFMNSGNQKLFSQLVENVRLYDTYTFKETNDMRPKHLQALSFMLGTERFINRYLTRIKSEDSTLKLIDDNDMDFITAKMEMEQRAIDNFTVDDVYPIDIYTENRVLRTALVLHTKGAGISELSYQFLNKHPEFDIMVNFSLVGQGKFEIRTVKTDIDLGNELATSIGGGGHKLAAGAPLSSEYRKKLVDLLTEALNSGYVKSTNTYELSNGGIITEGDLWFR